MRFLKIYNDKNNKTAKCVLDEGKMWSTYNKFQKIPINEFPKPSNVIDNITPITPLKVSFVELSVCMRK
jgi:hypothetical protein